MYRSCSVALKISEIFLYHISMAAYSDLIYTVALLRHCVWFWSYNGAFNPRSANYNCSRRHFVFSYFSVKIRLNILCESSARADDSHEMPSLIFSEK